MFALEQLILQHNAQLQTSDIKPGPTGIDFFFAKPQDARKLVEFISSVFPTKHHTSQVS